MAMRVLLRRGSCGSGRPAGRTGVRLRRFALLLVLTLIAAMLAVVPSAHAGVLDQSQPTLGSASRPLFPTRHLAQSFTAGVTGGLDQVDVAVVRHAANLSTPLTVEIWAVSSGVPTAPVLASASVAAASVPAGSATLVSVPFPSAAAVTAGVQYAIALSAPGCPPPLGACYRGNVSGVNPYPAGTELARLSVGEPWISFPCCDLAFKTYVAPPVRPTSKQQCKKGGWRRFTNPSFKNQGQCVAYVNHRDGKGKADSKNNGKKKGHGKKK